MKFAKNIRPYWPAEAPQGNIEKCKSLIALGPSRDIYMHVDLVLPLGQVQVNPVVPEGHIDYRCMSIPYFPWDILVRAC